MSATFDELAAEAGRWLRFAAEDLEELLVDSLPDDWTVHESSADLARLSLWLVESRYPGEWPEATASDAAEALADARDVFAVMRSDLSARGVPSAS